MELPPEAFDVYSFDGDGYDYTQPGRALGEAAKRRFVNPGILIYSGGVGVDGESIIKGIKNNFDHEIPIYG